jgi:Fe-Mn family superoxide dismutase
VKHSLPELPYALDALAPHVSAETLEYHWGKHHRAYVDTLNRLLPATPLEGLGLEALVRRASGGVLNQAAQHFNHSVYWLSLSPKGGGEPEGALLEALGRRYGSFAASERRSRRRPARISAAAGPGSSGSLTGRRRSS